MDLEEKRYERLSRFLLSELDNFVWVLQRTQLEQAELLEAMLKLRREAEEIFNAGGFTNSEK